MHICLGLGSNLGQREQYLNEAIASLVGHPDIEVMKRSTVYETEAVGMAVGTPPFLNQVVLVRTDLSLVSLLDVTQQIERQAGRDPAQKGQRHSRTLDIDLLIAERETCDWPALTMPHPELVNRDFVLRPLCELVPDWVHPHKQATLGELLRRCQLARA